ncbi:MAG: hypothetical protein RL215_1943 [Planctomycetota bacterium]
MHPARPDSLSVPVDSPASCAAEGVAALCAAPAAHSLISFCNGKQTSYLFPKAAGLAHLAISRAVGCSPNAACKRTNEELWGLLADGHFELVLTIFGRLSDVQ